MNGSLTGAWIVGTGIYVYRQVSNSHRPPVPGALLGVTLFFAGLALITEIAPASARTVALAAWGLDVAGILYLMNGKKLPGEVRLAQANEAASVAGQ